MSDEETELPASEKLKQNRYKGLRPWKPGQIPNPKGRPREPKNHAEVVSTIRANTQEILDTMFGIMRKARISPGDRTRFKPARTIEAHPEPEPGVVR